MLSRGIIAAAIIVYVAVLGCVMWKGDATPTGAAAQQAGSTDVPRLATSMPALTGLPYRSVGMQIQRVDWMDEYKKNMDEIAAIGADTVLLVVDARQENGVSSRIYLDMRMTPTPEQLGGLIRHARDLNLRVILMPIVLLDVPRDNEWRGTIKPESWTEWWRSYRDMIKHFAWIAEGNGANVLVVGSELVSTETPDKIDEWTRTINEIREIFKGQLTYSSNWDHYTAVKFWDQLDLIGMNSYWYFAPEKGKWKPGKEREITVDQVKKKWREIQDDLLPFVQKTGKPLLFLEVGWCSIASMGHEPWDYTLTEPPLDLDIQRRLYVGFFESWYGNPNLGGFSIWEWTPGDGGKDHRGYTPENKPAEQVLREWLAKPRWQVKM